MTTAMWTDIPKITHATMITAIAATGAAAGLIFWSLRRTEARLAARIRRGEQRAANMAGEISTLRDDTECLMAVHQIWAADREFAEVLFGQAEGVDRL